MSKHWSKEEIEILENNRAAGRKKIRYYLKKRLGSKRSLYAISHKARRSMIEIGYRANDVQLNWLLPRNSNNASHTSLVTKAKRDKVLRKSKLNNGTYVVPTWWADEVFEILEQHGIEHIVNENKRHARRKLSPEDVREIRKKVNTHTKAALSREYGVSRTNIRLIAENKIHKDVT